MKLLIFLIATLYMMGVVWVMYLAIMNLAIHRSKLTLPAKLFAYPIAFIGQVIDMVFNVTLGSLFFLERPDIPTKEELSHLNLSKLMFTYRCEKHMKNDSWRGEQARWWCENFLNPFAPDGRHCK